MKPEDFDKYWRKTHAKASCELHIFQDNILKYEELSSVGSPPFLNLRNAIADEKPTNPQIRVDKTSAQS